MNTILKGSGNTSWFHKKYDHHYYEKTFRITDNTSLDPPKRLFIFVSPTDVYKWLFTQPTNRFEFHVIVKDDVHFNTFYIYGTTDPDATANFSDANTQISTLGLLGSDVVVSNTGDVFTFTLANLVFA